MHIGWLAVGAVLPSATAFYPYKFDDGSGTANARRTPSLESRQPRGLTLPLHRVPRDNKYTIVNSDDPTQSNSVAIDQDGTDVSYMVAVSFGGSKEEYHMLLDSAASNTWVMGADCTSEACGKHNTFGTADSGSLKTDTEPFSITYGTGSVEGTTASDTVHIGSLSSKLTFGLATNVSEEFNSYPMDGILGIGRGDAKDNTISAPQLIEALSSSKQITSKLYGVHLSRASSGPANGELNIGEANTAHFSGALNWLRALPNPNNFWEIDIADAGTPSTLLGLTGRKAIIDTGTSYMLLPSTDAAALHALIEGSAQADETFSVPCDTATALQVKLGSTTYGISAADWVGGKLASGLCSSKVIGRQTFGADEWLMGDVFLKNVYTVLDFDNARVGFGVGGGDGESSSSASASAMPSSTATGGASSSVASATTAGGFVPAGASSTATPSSPSDAGNAAAASQQGAGPATTVPCLCAVFLTSILFILAI